MPLPDYPLSFAQQRLWFLDQLAPGTALYNIPLVLELEGPLDAPVLERALGEIVRRHEPLRTVFPHEGGRPRQEVLPAHSFVLPVDDLSNVLESEREAVLDQRILDESRRPFDLTTGPIFRAALLKLNASRHLLVAAVHHISFDGWSMGIFFRELAALYAAFSTGAPSPLPELPTRYIDFAARQREWLTGDTFAMQMAYWKDHLRPPRPLLALPTDRLRPAAQTSLGHRDHAMLSEALISALQDFSRREGVTLFMTMLAIYATLLHRLTGQDDVVIGTPIANRTSREIEPLIGFFANSLALRMNVSGEPTFRALVAQAKRVCVGAYSHQDLPFERIVEELNPERSLGHAPILQTFLVLDNTPYAVGDHVAAGPLTIRRRQVTTGTSKVDMTLVIRRGERGRRVSLESSADLFEPATGTRMLHQYCQLIESALEHPESPITRLRLLSEGDRRQVMADWNATAKPYDLDKTIVVRFEEQAARTPDADAVVCGGERVSYAALNRRANRLAHELRARGVDRDQRVAICLERTPRLVVAVLAVLKAGGAYVPLDPAYPRDRLAFIMADAGCSLVLTEPTLAKLVGGDGRQLLFADQNDSDHSMPAANGEPVAASRDLAYVIYTSGSTGRPKGVAIEHHSVVNLVSWALDTFSRDELSGMLASTSISFDLSVFELFVPLCCGGTAILVDNLLRLPQTAATARVTFINTVPSVMQELLRFDVLPSNVAVVALAGEPLRQSLVERLYEQSPGLKVFDLYGPTETTVYATCALRTRGGVANIGGPIANTTALVLDRLQHPVPVGVAGELYLGGAGTAREYLGRPGLTSESFVECPVPDASVGRVYRTGDRARWRADGSLEFLGRLDRQIKLRGFRIELGEVESALTAYPSIRDTVVVQRQDAAEEARLVGYVVEEGPCTDEDIYRHLEQRLPHYMIPWSIIRLPELPRLPNGKIDHSALQGSEAIARVDERIRPRTATEEAIAAVWRDVLRVSDLGVDEHFFRLGGHSLLATQVAWRLQRLFNLEVEVDLIFRAPTIAELARRLDARPPQIPSVGNEKPGRRAIPADMRTRLLDEWAGRTTPYPRDCTITQLFEARVAEAADAPALVGAGATWTYGELNERANRLARYLQARIPQASVQTSAPIGVALERSPEAIVALLAVLKAGGAYVPLDPAHPPARLKALVERAGLGLIVTRAEIAGRLPVAGACVVLLDSDADAIAAQESSTPAAVSGPDALAYVLFTSGTTGQPKAVGVPHRAIVRLVHGLPDVPLGRDQTVLHMAPLAFDASTFEVWGPLAHGGRIVVAPDRLISSRSLEALLFEHGVTVLWLTASLFNAIVDDGPGALASVRHLLIGGEALSVPHVARALSALPATRVVNGYGPTEATTFTCAHVISSRDAIGAGSIPIGRPLANTRVYVLGSDRELLPEGEPGELWIGGDGLAVGYLGDVELTAACFVPDPFVADVKARMYKSGDRVRFLPDGTLEFLGRVDDQIKIRGFRIEPGEIEAALAQHPRVRRAAVAAVHLPVLGNSLIAFVVPAPLLPPDQHDEPIASALRDFLSTRLPEHMVPSQWIALDALPLLASGKIDRGQLPALATRPRPVRASASTVPRSTIEGVIAGIWREILGIADPGVHDDFFEVGGHSLLATQVLSRIQSTLGVSLDLRTLFATPTVAGLAQGVEALIGSARKDSPIPRVSRERELALSFAQQRLWFLQQWFAGSAVYNVPAALRIEGALDVDAMTRAIQEIVARHETLRTVFPLAGGLPVQRVFNDVSVDVPVTDLSGLAAGEAEDTALAIARDEGGHIFDLGAGPLFRVALVKLTSTTHILLLTLHHIIADGWSIGVLFSELGELYAAAQQGRRSSLAPLSVQYPDFAEWQRQQLSGSVLERDLAYWREQLRAPRAVLDLPLDRPRPPESTGRGGRVPLSLSPERVRALERFCAVENVTMFMALLAVFQALLHRYSGQDDVCVGTPVANRTRPETEALIGCFVNTLVMRGDLSGDPTFRTLIRRTRGTAIDSQVHQDLPFELLVDALNVERSPNHAPLFQAMFGLHEGAPARLELPGLTVSRVPVGFDYAKFELNLELRHATNVLRGSLEYNADLFERQTAERMATDWQALLEALLADPDRRLSEIALDRPSAGRPGARVDALAAVRAPAAPRESGDPTEVETKLVEIWQKVLEVSEVGADDDFFELGGNSMRAVRLLAEIEDRFRVTLRLSTLFRHGTVRTQATLVSSGGAGGRSTIVPIQPLGARRPFFLVHGIGGEVISFQALARHVAGNQPIYGLQADTSAHGDFRSRIEDVAAHYLRAIRAMEPRGPYRLGGYSAGGVIAYEMAQQLRAAGEDVALLAMLDAPAPRSREAGLTPASAWRLLKNAAYWPIDDQFFRMGWPARRARVQAKYRAMQTRLRRHGGAQDSDTGDVRDRLGLWAMQANARDYLERYVEMMQAYRPRPYDGAVTVLRARTLSLGFRGAPDLGWRTLAQGVTLRLIPGAHDTILKEPGVRRLAAALVECLDESAD
jgi:amino acid adenylation domain-containing protein